MLWMTLRSVLNAFSRNPSLGTPEVGLNELIKRAIKRIVATKWSGPKINLRLLLA